jgi:hypothetical protein
MGQGDGSLVPIFIDIAAKLWDKGTVLMSCFLLTSQPNCDMVRLGDGYAEIRKASK